MLAETAVVWTSSPAPQRIADLRLTGAGIELTGGPIGLVSRKGEPGVLPPQLQVLLPPRDPRNLQRRVVQTWLDREGIELRGRRPIEQDWLTLMVCGRNGIGCLDVFADDEAAKRYYVQAGGDARAGLELIPLLARVAGGDGSAADLEKVLDRCGPVAGVPGMQPKALVGEWLVKFDNPAYPGLLTLECLAYEAHKAAGFAVPEVRLEEIEGHQVLMSRRFDRGDGSTRPVESIYAIWSAHDPGRYRCNTDGSMELVLETLRRFGADCREAYGRFVLAVLTGNGDMHSGNVSVLGWCERAQLSPTYDPAPMRAYRGRANHDLLSALPFADIGGTSSRGYRPYADSGDTPPDLRARILKLADAAGLTKRQAKADLDKCLAATEGYAEAAVSTLQAAVPAGYQGRVPDVEGFARTLETIRRTLAT